MKRITNVKTVSAMVMTLALVVGCATSKDEPAKPAGPSAEVSQAIDDAKAAIANAAEYNALWRDTEKFLAEAEKAAAAGDEATALKLARKAESQAELGVNQHFLEKAKIMYAKASNARGLTAQQRDTLTAAGEAIRNGEGHKAYDMLKPMVSEAS